MSTVSVTVVLALLALAVLTLVLLILVLLVLVSRQMDVLCDARHARLVQDEEHVVARHGLGYMARSFDLDATVLTLFVIHLEGELDVSDTGRRSEERRVGKRGV